MGMLKIGLPLAGFAAAAAFATSAWMAGPSQQSGVVKIAGASSPMMTALSGGPCDISVGTNAPVACKLTSSLSGTVTWSFTGGAQTGMVVQAKTGEVRWTPMAAQTGSFTVNAQATNGASTENHSFTVDVTTGAANPAGIYVATNGNDSSGTGSATAPYKTLRKAVTAVSAGQTIYVRGGEYKNKEYGDAWSGRTEASLVRIANKNGTATQRITMRPFGNEYARLVSDVSGIALKDSDYWTIKGFEIVGNAASLDFNTSMANWWNEAISPLSGRGIPAAGSDKLELRDLIVHDFPGVGISVNEAEFATVADNIVYNNAWWSTGGVHGISLADLVTTSPANAAQQTILMTGNLAFGNQSLIISHVFNKGFVTLEIDEGNGLHMQNNTETFDGRALVENNLAMWNGKAGLGLNTFDKATIRNNGFYRNARVVDNNGELSLQTTASETVVDNLFHPRTDRRTIRDGSGAYTNVGANATLSGITLDGSLYPSIVRYAAVFANPGAFDFARASGLPSSMGIAATARAMWDQRLAEYGIVLAEPTQVVDATYMHNMKAAIFANWPSVFSHIRLDDKDTGYSYTYAQRCHYPSAPSSMPCP